MKRIGEVRLVSTESGSAVKYTGFDTIMAGIQTVTTFTSLLIISQAVPLDTSTRTPTLRCVGRKKAYHTREAASNVATSEQGRP